MIVTVLAALAADPAPSVPPGTAEILLLRPSGTPHAVLGSRMDSDGVGASASIGEEWVLGGDGRTAATRVSARWASSDLVLAAHLPFATYAVPGDDGPTQRTGLGNLRIDAFSRRQGRQDARLIGVQIHLPMGDAYTWTHTASGLWPGGGLTAVYQRRDPIGPAELLVRTAVGLHGTAGYAPFPRLYVHGSLAGGVDRAFQHGFGVFAEAAVSWWDPSPIDVGLWLRSEPGWAPGLRMRAGAIAPVGTWMGLSPSHRPAGVREATVVADVSASF